MYVFFFQRMDRAAIAWLTIRDLRELQEWRSSLSIINSTVPDYKWWVKRVQ